VRNEFTYHSYQWLVDLDQLPRPGSVLGVLAGFSARDHLGDPSRSIRANLDHYLSGHGIDLHGGQVLMLAHARVLGYVFNPLTVYWCHDPDGTLRCVVAEVHNTYGQRHAYLLHTDDRGCACPWSSNVPTEPRSWPACRGGASPPTGAACCARPPATPGPPWPCPPVSGSRASGSTCADCRSSPDPSTPAAR
jgi:hypothetical protein